MPKTLFQHAPLTQEEREAKNYDEKTRGIAGRSALASNSEAPKVISSLPCALALPAEEGDASANASLEVVVDPMDVVSVEADADDGGRKVLHGLQNLVDDGLELSKGRDVGDHLDDITLSGADGASAEGVLEDPVAVPADSTDDGESGNTGGDDAAEAAKAADGEATLPRVILEEIVAQKAVLDGE